MKTVLFSLLFVLVLGGCSAKNVLTAESKNVRIYDTLPTNMHCEYIDEIVGSEANLLTFLFMSNYDMTAGARAHLRNPPLSGAARPLRSACPSGIQSRLDVQDNRRSLPAAALDPRPGYSRPRRYDPARRQSHPPCAHQVPAGSSRSRVAAGTPLSPSSARDAACRSVAAGRPPRPVAPAPPGLCGSCPRRRRPRRAAVYAAANRDAGR